MECIGNGNRADLPTGVQAGLTQLFADEVYFVPIRHHSPACALALQHLLAEIRPAAVLIEAPDGFSSMLPQLQDPATRPPVALLAQTPDADDGSTRSAFYPFCDYSPEWVALRQAHTLGAQVAFIDADWQQRPTGMNSKDRTGSPDSLQEERYLAHSRWLAQLAQNAGCRDQHELWDHLFELRPLAAYQAWRSFFGDVFCWCAMARQEYEPEVLEREHSLPRERHMARWIKTWRARVSGPLVVVSGGFHTPELLHWRAAKPFAAPLPRNAPNPAGVNNTSNTSAASDTSNTNTNSSTTTTSTSNASNTGGQWLIRYGFTQLDALNHYAAGMPSPGWYQQVWQGMRAGAAQPGQTAAQTMLLQLTRHTRQINVEPLSTADLEAALLQALRLAQLRGHAGPGRCDVLDAITSCFLKREVDDGHGGLLADARRILTGNALGDIPPSANSPPLVEDARRQARRHGLRLDDSEGHTARLDLYRKPAHRERSRFFHLMDWLDTGLTRHLAGPDFASGRRLDILFEEWRYAWSPMVEARLIGLAPQGSNLQAVALARLQQEEQYLAKQGQSRNSARAVQLLLRACLIGLQGRLPALFDMLDGHLQEDPGFGSVVSCGHQLLILWQAREPLGLQGQPQLAALLQRAWQAALFLLPALAACKVEDEAAAISHLLALRELTQQLSPAGLIDPELLPQYLQRLSAQTNCAPGIEGAAAALLYAHGTQDGAQLAQRLRQHFGTGAEPEAAVRWLNGLLHTAPELLLHEPALLQHCNQMLADWDEAQFIAFLPDLRLAFTRLNPQETDALARALAQHYPGSALSLAPHHYSVSQAEMLQALALQQALACELQQDGLAHWLDAELSHG